MYSEFVGVNVNPKVRKPFVPQEVWCHFSMYSNEIDNCQTLIDLMKEISGGKHWGYYTQDVTDIWKKLFQGIMNDPENEECFQKNPILYTAFHYEEDMVFFWKSNYNNHNVELFKGNIQDSRYFIRSIHADKLKQDKKNNYLAPDNIDPGEEMEDIYEEEIYLHRRRMWTCIFTDSGFQRVKTENSFSINGTLYDLFM